MDTAERWIFGEGGRKDTPNVIYFIENFDMLRECFARHGMEVSLERLAADRFLQQAAVPRVGVGSV